MTTKNRLAKLESKAGGHVPPKENPHITAEMYARSMDTLARVLSKETGEPITGADAEKALKELNQ